MQDHEHYARAASAALEAAAGCGSLAHATYEVARAQVQATLAVADAIRAATAQRPCGVEKRGQHTGRIYRCELAAAHEGLHQDGRARWSDSGGITHDDITTGGA